MPELPEVECIVLWLRPKVVGRTLSRVEVPDPMLARSVEVLPLPAKVLDLFRLGKHVVFHLDQGFLVVHLRMSGTLLWGRVGRPAHTRCIFYLSRGALFFVDVRRLGTVEFREDLELGLGPDALSDLGFLRSGLGKSRVPIKLWLMNQTNIAGIGNIYASEILFEAGIDPRRPASSLTAAEVKRLRRAIPQVLGRAIQCTGSTLRDGRYLLPNGDLGGYTPQVYGREGQPCAICGKPIARLDLGGRGTFLCPHCQR